MDDDNAERNGSLVYNKKIGTCFTSNHGKQMDL